MDAPSMVHRSGDTLIVRSVVSGDQLYLDNNEQGANKLLPFHRNPFNNNNNNNNIDNESNGDVDDSNVDNASNLPQCKIKRNYSCNNCTFFTQNPRHFLTHLKDVHGEKIIINECKYCLYASKHYQKLVRHMKMVHGSTDGLEEQAQSRKRASQLAREQKKLKNSIEDIHLNQPLTLIHQQQQPHHQQQQQQQQQQQSHQLFVNNQSLTETSSSPDYANTKLLKCTVCEYSTLHREKLTEHEREEHNKTKFFRCEKCSYVTHIKARFSKHVKYHSMPMIKCVLCDFRTPYKWNLDRHMKNHGGAGLYKCSACNFTADIKQSLTVHEMNHHVPPVGHASGMSMARRRNKVGGTDIVEQYSPMNLSDSSVGMPSGLDFSMNNNNNNASLNSYNEPMAKKIRMEEHEQQWYQSMAADLSQKPHTETTSTQRKPARPVPNLIPIQPAISSPTAMNLSVVAQRSFHDSLPATMTKNERALNDLAILLSASDAMNMQASENMIANSKRIFKELMAISHQNDGMASNAENVVSTPQLSPTSSNASSVAKRKTVNFFEELKEKLIAANGGSLMCRCGHSSKCLSELVIHQKMCNKNSQSPVNLSTSSSSGSTRCQFCRQRCKSSGDLIVHMQHCMEARSNADSMESISSDFGSTDKVDGCDDMMDESCDEENEKDDGEPHPMEHKVFVWNKMPERRDNDNEMGDDDRDDNNDDVHNERNEDSENTEDGRQERSKYFAVETAPGYGEVTKKMNPDDEPASGSLKKVFKCPHCTFWASTASRFHVHIVGHLNKKPFECSLCSYRSNWRWDITKHIRLKTIRDPSHKTAKVLMNDETGRRNYTKYNKHITLMKVDAEDGDPKLLKSGEMTPSQEANLSFLGQKSDSSNIPQKAASRSTEVIDLDNEIPLSLVKPPTVSFEPISKVVATASTTDDENDPNKQSKAQKSESKVTSFKCKKCSFRDANREVVLNHVKGHYQEAGIKFEDKNVPAAELSHQIISQLNPSPPITLSPIPTTSSSSPNKLYLSKLLSAAMGFPNLNVPPQIHASLKSSHLPNIDSVPLNLQKPIAIAPLQTIPADMTATTSTSTTSSSSAAVAVVSETTAQPTIEHGEMDEASSLGTSVTGWRDPAPYRCGHCHQVSNWKHVIQRHCRLKHNGDINIELIEKRNSNKRTYVRLNCPTSSGQRSNHHDIVESASSDDVQDHHTISKSRNVTPQPPPYNAEKCGTSGNYSTDCINDTPKSVEIDGSEDAPKSVSNQPNPPNQLIQLLNKKPKRYQCTSCPYVSPCRSQLESHNKFHNLNECGTFQCRHCSYNVTKKHLLYQHQKMHEYEKVGRDETNEDSSASEAIDLTSSLLKSDHEKPLMFCSYCPARYLNEKELRGHLKMHASFFPYRCAVCTYTSRQESYIETHMNVHSSSYQQKTKFMIDEFDIRSDYPQPTLSSIPSENRDENALWIVSSELNQKQRLNASSGNDIDLDEMILSSKVPNKTFTSPPKVVTCSKPSTSIDNTATTPSPPHKLILQAQGGGLQNRESKQNKIVISKPEKCPHCPFCTTKPDVLKEHMQCHVSVSGVENQQNCDHCDYSVSDELVLKEHVKLHFSSSSLSPTLIANRKSVAFFTCYDGLMLSIKSESDDSDGGDTRTIYPIAGDQELEESASDKENKKIIVDINTGEEIK